MKTSDFNYTLPQEMIAQRPLTPRDASRLLVLDKGNGRIDHKQFTDILEYFNPGDILVVNNSRVIPGRLYGRKPTGGKAEILLLEQLDEAFHSAATHKVLRAAIVP
jgi:S-adenosylmethionine:tRNA ribosyltransferase-isomerase